MARFLGKEGYEVVAASTGDEGLRLAREARPVAITLDVMMPGEDGWSVLARLKAEGQAILLIDKTLGAVLRLADRHVVVEKGRTVWTGSSAALAAAPGLRETYLHV